MDVQALYDCFVGTLQADQRVRQQAELSLRQLEKQPGFLGLCMDIIKEEGVSPVIKKSCCIFFKNRVIRNWGEQSKSPIDHDERPIVKEKLIPLIVNSPMDIRNLLFPILSTILAYDYPQKWPEFLPNSILLLSNVSDLQSVYAGLLCLSEVARSYRWSNNADRPQLDQIIQEIFPNLLEIGNSILNDTASHKSYESGEMVKLILKIYKFSTYFDLPAPLQEQQAVINWCTFHVNVMNMALPQNVMDLDPEDRVLHPWCKSQKWAYANIFRLFQRYGSLSLSKKFEYTGFRNFFILNFIPELLSLFFTKIEQWRRKEIWISNAAIYNLIQILEMCIVQKETFKYIKDNIPTLVEHFIYPLLCPTDETLDTFENDPVEYIHVILDVYEDSNSPDMAVISLMFTLVDKKPKTTLEPILSFCYQTLTSLQQQDQSNIEVAKHTEGILRTIGSISHQLVKKKSPFYSQLEQFLNTFVFPHFKSSFLFLRARTCDVACKFSDLEFQNEETVATLYNGILSAFNDHENLPVQLEAALGLQAFIQLEKFREALGNVIVPTMQNLLELSNKIENDAIAAVMQECVESFSEQLQPFGVDLMTKLSEQLMRLLVELNNGANVDIDEVNDGGMDDLADKEMALLGLLNTMITVLLSFENSTEIVFKLEACYIPCVNFIFDNNMEDYYQETGELLENTTFLTRSVSDNMWDVFGKLFKSLMDGGALLYFEEFISSIKNIIIYGATKLKSNPSYAQYFYSLFEKIAVDEESGYAELNAAFELAQVFILTLGEVSSNFIPDIVKITITLLETHLGEKKNLTFVVNCIDVILAGFVHSTDAVLSVLVQTEFVEAFFGLWFKVTDKLRRVYDLKLFVLGYMSLTSCTYSNFPFLEQIYPQIGKQLSITLSKLPEAITQLEKQKESYNADSHYDEELYYGNEEDDEWVEDEDEEVTARGTDDYLSFLESESKKFRDDQTLEELDEEFLDDGELIDDTLSVNPLDSIDIFQFFKNGFINIQQANANVYNLVISSLDNNEQRIFEKIVELAGK